jgi:tRNA-splicing ligase RtcB (3'-phosphate/5'-hydroxy nucleic acid ligase)
MKLVGNIAVWGEPEEGAMRQIKVCAETADRVALMADHHKGYAVPIGGVLAYKDAISPSGVGFDIACGNKAVRLQMPGGELRAGISKIMDDVWQTISFGIGRRNSESVDHPVFESPVWKYAAVAGLRKMAGEQLGTVGSGNHYVDLFTDELDRVWVGVHFGSRGLGHKTATWFLRKAGAKDGMDVEPCVIGAQTDLGAQYLDCMHLAGEYAYAGRDWVCERVAKLLGAPIVEQVHNHHNFAWQETHAGEEYWVVRKGATPAFPGQKGFVGGTMGEISVILEGVEHENAKHSLYSTVHGAGRTMGRLEAKGKTDRRTGQVVRPGKVTREMMEGWLQRSRVELRGGGLDESPDCYKRLTDVLAEHGESVRILHTLTPVGVAMAGANEFDPYKD